MLPPLTAYRYDLLGSLAGIGSFTLLTDPKAGTPLVKGAKVLAEVVGAGKGPKIYVFKFKRRKNYRRKTGHRQKYTEVRITDVKLG